jgi:hypothetical protein
MKQSSSVSMTSTPKRAFAPIIKEQTAHIALTWEPCIRFRFRRPRNDGHSSSIRWFLVGGEDRLIYYS